MKGTNLLLLMGIAIFAIGCKRASDVQVKSLNVTVPADFVSHRSKEGNIELKAPASWHEEQGISDKVILDLLPEDHHSDFNVVMLGPSTHDLPSLLDSMKKPNHKFLKSEFIRVSDTDSVRYVAEIFVAGKHLIADQTIIPMRSHTYTVTFVTLPGTYDSDVPIAQATLASFKGQP